MYYLSIVNGNKTVEKWLHLISLTFKLY